MQIAGTSGVTRRNFLQILAAQTVGISVPIWAQPARAPSGARPLTVAQIVDMSARQVDVTKDFLLGSRVAWQEINAKGGLQGAPVKHLVMEVDGTVPSLRDALNTIRADGQCALLFGTAGDTAAAQITAWAEQEAGGLAHVAPWLHSTAQIAHTGTFPIFATRPEQFAHAIKSLSVMGVHHIGVVYGSAQEHSLYHQELASFGGALKLSITPFQTQGDLLSLAQSLRPDSPRILLFIGGTPELVRFTQGIQKQATQRYVIAMSDVNLQSMSQLGISRYAPIIATQVVPMVNSNLPLVKAFRTALGKLADEAPSALSLAGYVAARYAYEVLQSVDGAITRRSALQAFSRRAPVDLGGLRIAPDGKASSTPFVTQSMIAPDGRLVG